MSATLKRVALKPPKQVSDDVRQIARQAYVVLGYRHLLDEIGEGTELLSTALRRLGIKPYSRSSVGEYQEQKQKELRESRPRTYSYWQRSNLKFASDVPAFVLRKAIQIKLAAPECKLFVETLANHPDPFLVVKQGNEEYYVEVWDEKEFEERL